MIKEISIPLFGQSCFCLKEQQRQIEATVPKMIKVKQMKKSLNRKNDFSKQPTSKKQQTMMFLKKAQRKKEKDCLSSQQIKFLSNPISNLYKEMRVGKMHLNKQTIKISLKKRERQNEYSSNLLAANSKLGDTQQSSLQKIQLYSAQTTLDNHKIITNLTSHKKTVRSFLQTQPQSPQIDQSIIVIDFFNQIPSIHDSPIKFN